MENLICSAYTYIEFGGDFEEYKNDPYNLKDGASIEALVIHWKQVCEDYEHLSEYMSDDAIRQAQQFVINER